MLRECPLTVAFSLQEDLLPLSQNWRFASSPDKGRHGVVETLSHVQFLSYNSIITYTYKISRLFHKALYNEKGKGEGTFSELSRGQIGKRGSFLFAYNVV